MCIPIIDIKFMSASLSHELDEQEGLFHLHQSVGESSARRRLTASFLATMTPGESNSAEESEGEASTALIHANGKDLDDKSSELAARIDVEQDGSLPSGASDGLTFPDVRRETACRIVMQVFLPFLIAGFGTVSAGMLLDTVQVKHALMRSSRLIQCLKINLIKKVVDINYCVGFAIVLLCLF